MSAKNGSAAMRRRDFGLGLLAASAWGNVLPGWSQTPAPPATGWTIPSNDDIWRLLAERIEVQRQGVGIVVGVIDAAGPRIVSYGKSGAARPLDGDTLFQIGSVSKTFVTLLLADMVLRGEVRLDDPAQKYLPPGVRMRERGRPITLQDLATHMSGLPSMPANFDLKSLPNPVEAYTAKQWYEFLSSWQPPRDAGTKLEYSNQGVALLGHLLALHAGKPYEQLLKERALDPLGLEDTAITLTSGQKSRLALGHDMYGRAVDSWEMRTLQASGSMRSTANDLLRYLAAYTGYRDTPMRAAMALQTHQPRPPGSSTNQSLGVVLLPAPVRDETIYFHDGGKEGYRSLILFNLQARTGLVILANARSQDNINALGLHLFSGRAMPAPKPAPSPPPERKTVLLPRNLLNAYEGRYRMADKTIALACLGDRLLLDLLGDGVSELFCGGAGEYFSRTSDMRVSFPDSSGAAAPGFILREGGKEEAYTRVR